MLSLLASGIVLGYIKDQKQRKELIRESDRIWRSIDRNQLFHALNILKMKKLVRVVEMADNNRVSINNRGRIRARRYLLDSLEVKKTKKWDGKWRIVIFDVPESRKSVRDGLRYHLKRLGFSEFQKSVFAIPYPCEDEIVTLINLMGLKDYVRYLESSISYEADLKKEFKLR